MRIFAAVASLSTSTVTGICTKIGESVESKDLFIILVWHHRIAPVGLFDLMLAGEEDFPKDAHRQKGRLSC